MVAFLRISGVSAASVGLGVPAAETVRAEADTRPSPVSPVVADPLDAQLAQLPGGARGFADRVSRTQEWFDLERRRMEDQKRGLEEAARKKAAGSPHRGASA
ncbi:hypothetical protein ABZ038_02305 [Streptomyces sp. NPDC006349]|uniref:hypothetical protein n=1 Tax=Streptomyces sp. NPDC006349 TaxID=3156757 RepID=UPI0006B96856|nr:hypothetical protein ADL35_32750 [Streptomyces sp. NRRL WC-3753]